MRWIATVVALLFAAPAAVAKGPSDVIRVGGPSPRGASKVAIVGTHRKLAGHGFEVIDSSDDVVLTGELTRVPGRAAPWQHAYAADLTDVSDLGSYRVQVAGLTSRPWTVDPAGTRDALDAILGFFAGNRDGNEPSPVHDPSHLNDARIHPAASSHAGGQVDMTGGWMDAGDMIHFTQTTAFAASALQGAARLDPNPAVAAGLNDEADVGVRWLAKAHPFPNAFVAQVGDERDHERGWTDPADDDGSGEPGIGHRLAYTLPPDEIGGDLAGKTATALAMAYQRLGTPSLLTKAEDWYAAGEASGAPAPKLKDAGYPGYAAGFYHDVHWRDSMAGAAMELYRATSDPGYLDDLNSHLHSTQSRADGTIGVVDSFATFAEADACGALGAPAVPDEDVRRFACKMLHENGHIAVSQAHDNAFGMPGFFTWGTTAQNGGSGALAALATTTPQGLADGCEVAAGARDYMLGRNPFGRSLVVGYGPRTPEHPHHWASVFGTGLPEGAVVGGPAPATQVHGQGFHPPGPLQSSFATYEDVRRDYVTSEPALDYAATSELLLAAVRADCE